MKKFLITWSERYVMEIDADSKEEVREMWDRGHIDITEACPVFGNEPVDVEIDEV